MEDYPWDRHTTTLWLSVFREAKGRDPEALNVRLQADGAWPGLDIDLNAVDSTDWDCGGSSPWQLDIALTRSVVTTIVVHFSIVLTWVLIASVVGMTLAVVIGGRTTEIAMVAFFWGHAVAIVVVGVISGVWLWRRPPKDEHTSK